MAYQECAEISDSELATFQVDHTYHVATCREALEDARERNTDQLPSFLLTLALAVRARYEDARALDDLREVISLFHSYLDLSPDDSLAWNLLGDALDDLYEWETDSAFCDQAIAAYRTALQLCPEDSVYYIELHSKLSIALGHRFNSTGSRDDIDEAVKMDETALSLCKEDSPHRDICVSNLAAMCDTRFKSFGAIEDLDRCILLNRQVLELRSPAHPHFRTTLHHLSTALDSRYALYQDLPDLDQAIKILEDALPLYSGDEPRRSNVLAALARVLLERFRRPGGPVNVDRSIALLKEAIAGCKSGPAVRSSLMLNLSAALDTRYSHFGDPRDLDEGIELDRGAVEMLPVGHALRAVALVSSAVSLDKRFVLSERPEDANNAMELVQEGLRSLASGDKAHPWAVLQLAELYMTPRTQHFDLSAAVSAICSALEDPLVIAQYTIEQATRIFSLLRLREPWRDERFDCGLSTGIIKAYELFVSHLPRIAYLGLDLRKRLHVLEYAQDAVLDGATYALLLLRPRLAMELLESGRGVFWTQALRLRTPFDDLPQELSLELKQTASQLEQLSQGRHADVTNSYSEDENASSARRLTQRFEALLHRASSFPEFGHMLRQDLGQSIAQVADRGHVAMLIASGISCHAIVLAQYSHEPCQIALAEITPDYLRSLADHLRRATESARKPGLNQNESRNLKKVLIGAKFKIEEEWSTTNVLRDLWMKIVKPIFAALEIEVF